MSHKSLWHSLNRWALESVALQSNNTFLKKLSYQALRRFGELSMLAIVLMVAYYTVISGWVLGYLVNYLLRHIFPHELLVGTDVSEENFLAQFVFSLLHLGICYFYVRRGIHIGLERLSYLVAPLFIAVLFYLCYQSLTLPNAMETIRYLLYPDFTKVNYAMVNQAFGHMILSLGLGLGTIMTFGSYFKPQTDITSAGAKVVLLSMFSSAISVLILCPMVLGAPYAIFGPKLLFQTLPELIFKFPQGELVLSLFYITLYLSSVVATTGLLVSLCSNLSDRFQVSRITALRWSGLGVIVFILFPILGTTLWKHFRWMNGVSLLESADGALVNYFLPLLALGVSYLAYFLLPKKSIQHEFTAKEIHQEISHFYPVWRTIILWVAPGVLFLSFLLRFIGQFF